MPAIGNTDEILTAIGASAFRALVEARGGSSLRVPRSISSAAHLVQWLGEEAAHRLVEEYGGFVIDVPNLKATPAYDHRVVPLLDKMSDWHIATTVGCTERTVRNIRRRATGNLPGLNSKAER
ncbi:MAG: helix-turn-helix domain-containing protein [Sphingomonas sp.]|nr:helix-turn-helix domain-containing protein [Sphingomonas sp.]